MRRNKTLLERCKGRVRDINRHIWCTYDNFRLMYDNVYDAMVETKVAVKLDDSFVFDICLNELSIDDPDWGRFAGLPTNFKLLRPENVIFDDETGKTTNQKSDGQVGGQRFIVSVDGDCIGSLRSTTDMHFTVLCFIAGTGEPVMCAVIFKSEKEIHEIPLSWQYGIDITKN
jgi:hypothetical protein